MPRLLPWYRLDPARDRPLVMGIMNVTPDSFSDGALVDGPAAALARAAALREDGADLIDIGGESTRPGAPAVGEAEELRRVIPVVEVLVREAIPVSVDTMKAAVMRAVIDAGAQVINDVNAFRGAGTVDVVKGSDVGLVVMHMQGTPATMQQGPRYEDVVAEVGSYLIERARQLEAAGVSHERIVLDPGFGFGKSLEHNRELFRGLGKIALLGYPVLAGVSRKRMIGEFTGRAVDERTAGSVAAAMLAVQNGASLVRVHDVRETVDALKVWMELR